MLYSNTHHKNIIQQDTPPKSPGLRNWSLRLLPPCSLLEASASEFSDFWGLTADVAPDLPDDDGSASDGSALEGPDAAAAWSGAWWGGLGGGFG